MQDLAGTSYPYYPSYRPLCRFFSARSHHSCGAGNAASPPLFIILIFVTSPTLIIDGAATIGAVAFTDAVKVEEDAPSLLDVVYSMELMSMGSLRSSNLLYLSFHCFRTANVVI